ncbi:calpain-A-like isoform X2 [Saccostrea echinata]|uniref:calpain-A-like isoform X2 n=1 Tax=Saccostrea echinata TaxID=191078 RepID=UPI002A80661B|nr:calpain-A-like isoform X2 [Saccostrea echinata]
MADFNATFLYFSTEDILDPSSESSEKSKEQGRLKSMPLENTSSKGNLGRQTEKGPTVYYSGENLGPGNQTGTEHSKGNDFRQNATFIQTGNKTEEERKKEKTSMRDQFSHNSEDNASVSKILVSKSTRSSIVENTKDVYLQYKTQEDETFFFVCDIRCIPEEYLRKPHPNSDGDDIWADPEFPFPPIDIFSQGTTWVRSKELIENPVLFQKALSCVTVFKGCFDTAKFLVTFLTVMENNLLFSKVYKSPSSSEENKRFYGVVHFRFWYFGQWVDVYVDDKIPVQEGCLVMTSHSASFTNDIGITMAEKAYAKFIGSYKNMEKMEFDDFFHGLTGGYAVQYKFRFPVHGSQVFSKIRDALDSGAYIFCSVKSIKSYFFGLEENKEYSIIGTLEITTYLNEHVCLVKLRNIWSGFEWTGPWSHGSEWAKCPFDVYKRYVAHSDEKCFFYMDVNDFLEYFEGFTIGSVIPDFKFNGPSNMDYHVSIYGEWRGHTAASFTNHLNNPKIQFTVSKEENLGKHLFDVGIILTQKIINKEKPYGIHCSLLKVVDTPTDGTYIVKYIGQKMEYYTQEQVAIRQNLSHGLYVIVPSTEKNGQERQFLIRVFSEEALHNIGSLPESRRLVLCGEEGLYQEEDT